MKIQTRRAGPNDLDRCAIVLGDAFSDYSWTRWTVDSIDRYHVAPVDQQHREEPALARTTDRHLLAVDDDGQRSQRSQLGHGGPLGRRILHM
jgi:hypothetical protein